MFRSGSTSAERPRGSPKPRNEIEYLRRDIIDEGDVARAIADVRSRYGDVTQHARAGPVTATTD